jgi:hypothetical protein
MIWAAMGTPPQAMEVSAFVSARLITPRRIGIVSDNYIRLIPAGKNWQPAPEAAVSAAVYVTGQFSGPDGDVEGSAASPAATSP